MNGPKRSRVFLVRDKAGLAINDLDEFAEAGAGMGVALVPDTARSVPWPGVVYRELTSPSPQTELMRVYRKAETSPILAAFRRIVKESVNDGH